jgi:hypothetical protein
MQNPCGNLPISTRFLLYGSMLTHGSYWNGQNILRKYLNKDILGEPFVHRPYDTCIMHNPYGNLAVSTWFLLYGSMLTHGSNWNGQNILTKYLQKNILGEPFVYQPYLTCIMHNPYGNLPVSTWFLQHDSMLTHGILLEWSKYIKKISKLR